MPRVNGTMIQVKLQGSNPLNDLILSTVVSQFVSSAAFARPQRNRTSRRASLRPSLYDMLSSQMVTPSQHSKFHLCLPRSRSIIVTPCLVRTVVWKAQPAKDVEAWHDFNHGRRVGRSSVSAQVSLSLTQTGRGYNKSAADR